MKYLMIMAMLAMVLLAACSQNTDTQNTTNSTNNTDAGLGGAVKCTEPRPEFCTKEYMPVCGDNNRTYGNKCDACSDAAVNQYTDGACNNEQLFEVTYAGGFVMPEFSQTIFSVSGDVFTMETRGPDNATTSTKQRGVSAEDLGRLRDILAGINNLNKTYSTDIMVTDVGYADIVVGDERTRVDPNIDEAYPPQLLALRNWINEQSMQFPDASGRIYKSRDPDTCASIRFTCEEGMQYFGDESGCGCEPATDDSGAAGGTRLALTECSEPRPEMCTMQYDPVCAQVDTGIRCIKAPCPSTVYKTMGNACSACSDEKVYGYFPGECGELEGKTDEDLANV